MVKFNLTQVAQLFGIGRIEFAPGTWASLLTCILSYPLLKASVFIKIILIILIAWLGIFAADHAEKELGIQDPGSVVIDEVVGQLITLAFIAKPSFFCYSMWIYFIQNTGYF